MIPFLEATAATTATSTPTPAPTPNNTTHNDVDYFFKESQARRNNHNNCYNPTQYYPSVTLKDKHKHHHRVMQEDAVDIGMPHELGNLQDFHPHLHNHNHHSSSRRSARYAY